MGKRKGDATVETSTKPNDRTATRSIEIWRNVLFSHLDIDSGRGQVHPGVAQCRK